MNSVLRLDQKLARLTLPEPKAFGRKEIPAAPGDILIACVGFEDRALESLRRCQAAGVRNLRVVAIEYLPSLSDNLQAEFFRVSKKSGWSVKSVVHNREEPDYSGLKIVKHLDPDARIHVDISGMSRLLIVQLVSALVSSRNSLRGVRFLYATPKSYHPTKKEFEAEFKEKAADPSRALLFLSAGVHSVTIVPELSSLSMQGQPVRLIAFPSFNPHQYSSSAAVVQPAYIAAILGKAYSAGDSWRSEAIQRVNGLKDAKVEKLFTSTFDYRETFKALLELYDRYAGRDRLVLSPTGSKMQTLAVGLFRAYLEDIQIVYPTPRQFATPERYTEGVGNLFAVELSAFKP